jgi:hypothetical protein
LPEERIVVLSCVVVVGAGAFRMVVDVVVVVVGTGFSTTVVHEVKSMATARSGVTIISFFIVEVVPSWRIRRRFLSQMYFWPRFSNYFSP